MSPPRSTAEAPGTSAMVAAMRPAVNDSAVATVNPRSSAAATNPRATVAVTVSGEGTSGVRSAVRTVPGIQQVLDAGHHGDRDGQQDQRDGDPVRPVRQRGENH